jgi:DNA-3-methyladenine glycosylase
MTLSASGAQLRGSINGCDEEHLPITEPNDVTRLHRDFFARPATIVAPALLGMRLVRLRDSTRIAGIIVETEAYCDADEPDLACHGDRANDGRPTDRTAIMFGSAGFAYVYFTYGMHWMFNIVTGKSDEANAVLIRALEPTEGFEAMEHNRPGRAKRDWTNGPAKLASALAIDRSMNGIDLCHPGSRVWVEDAGAVDGNRICVGPRIGLGNTPEPWRSMPWRFWLRDNIYVSR